jgi:hypothetical protein
MYRACGSETKEIIPTRKKAEPAVTEKIDEARSDHKVIAGFYGATYLFDQIGKEPRDGGFEGIASESYRQILSLAYYLILEDRIL